LDPALDKAVREAPSGRRHAVLAQAGHWYDALALAVQNRDCGRDAALAELLEQPELRVAGPCLPATAVLNATGIGGGFCRSDGASRKKSDHLRLPELTVAGAQAGDWSGRWESNPRHSAWEADVLPLNYARPLKAA
jgi:hypothetical protein